MDLKYPKMTKKKYNLLSLFLKYAIMLAIVGPMFLLIICVLIASQGVWGPLPDFKELEDPETNLATEIISSDQKVLGKYFYENRTHVDYDELSPYIINALIATEDERFFDHSGMSKTA